MSEVTEPVAAVLPVCPYCKTTMTPYQFHGYYESFPMWECLCEEIPGAKETHGCYA